MKLKTTAILFALLMSFAADAQVTLNGITLPAKLQADNTALVLNGGAIRKKLFFKVYTIGLYLPAKSKNAAEIISGDGAVGVRLVITSGVINSGNMSEAIMEGFEKSTKGNTAPLKAKIDAFINTFKSGEIKEGDVFDIFYVPGVGVKSTKNGKSAGAPIVGQDFKKALFGIWLSDTPIDDDVKAALLG